MGKPLAVHQRGNALDTGAVELRSASKLLFLKQRWKKRGALVGQHKQTQLIVDIGEGAACLTSLRRSSSPPC